MRNPFKKKDSYDYLIDDVIIDLISDIRNLQAAVRELREEVDFLVDALDD